jgi:hypothetical protein
MEFLDLLCGRVADDFASEVKRDCGANIDTDNRSDEPNAKSKQQPTPHVQD